MAGRIPKRFIEDLLTRVDIVEVIDARVPLKKAGKDYKACCPFHEEKTASFTVSPDKQFYHCFGCGAHGTALGFLMEYERLSFPEAVEELARGAGMEVPREGPVEAAAGTADDNAVLLQALQQAERFYRRQLREHPQAQEAIDYLRGRGLTGEIAARFGLGYAAPGWDHLLQALGRDEAARATLLKAGLLIQKDNGGYYDRFRNRVMFPIHDYRGRIVGFGGRTLADDPAKYLNSPETPLFHKGRELYGLYLAREALRREQRAIVVEGYMDVVALAQFGIDFVVATLGTATTRDHLERLFRFTPEVVFCFDGDRAGREAAWRALETTLPVLQEGRQAGFLFLPEGEDPDTLVRTEGAEAFRRRIQAAQPLSEYLFATLAARVDLGRMDGRARLVELARPLVSNVPPGVLRQMLLDRLAELSRMRPETLTALLIAPAKPAFMRAAAPPRGGQQRISLMRLAIAMLVHRPDLAPRAKAQPWLQELADVPGFPLFTALLELLGARPDLNSAAIIENFRDSEHQQALTRLACWRHPALEHDIEAEFVGALQQLQRKAEKACADRLLAKQGVAALSPEERVELARILNIRRDETARER